MADLPGDVWLRCSACRKDLLYGKIHWVCSVSTCNRSRTRLVFCSVACWDSHVATLRHRDSWAVEARAPSRDEWARVRAAEEAAAGPATVPSATAHRAPSVSSPTSLPPRGPSAPMGGTAPVRPATGGVAPASPLSAPSPLRAPSPSPAPSPAPSSSSSFSSSSASPESAAAFSSSFAGGITPRGPALSSSFEREVLIVVSKMKKYIKDRSGMSTSDAVAEALSDHVRLVCDEAIRIAASDGRKTVLERDVPRPRR